MEKIQTKRMKKGDLRRLVFFIVDDTCCKKETSTKKMEALSFQYSHESGTILKIPPVGNIISASKCFHLNNPDDEFILLSS
jgi:hypothetical protein